MLEDCDDVFLGGCGDGRWSGVLGYEVVEYWHGDCSAGFVEEYDGDE